MVFECTLECHFKIYFKAVSIPLQICMNRIESHQCPDSLHASSLRVISLCKSFQPCEFEGQDFPDYYEPVAWFCFVVLCCTVSFACIWSCLERKQSLNTKSRQPASDGKTLSKTMTMVGQTKRQLTSPSHRHSSCICATVKSWMYHTVPILGRRAVLDGRQSILLYII